MKAAAGLGNKEFAPYKILHVDTLSDQNRMNLIHNPDFQEFSRIVTGIPQTSTQRFKSAVKKATIVGEGLNKLESKGIKGKILSESYWLESISPEKYYGGDIHEFFDAWQKTDSKLSFQDWFEQANPSKVSYDDWSKDNVAAISLSKVAYLKTAEERAPYRLSFENGVVMRNGNIFDTMNESTSTSGEGVAIFVMDAEGILYAGSHVTGKFHHSSFLAGAAIAGAGELRTDGEGHIISITNKSGHYKPDKDQILNSLKALSAYHVDLSNVDLQVQTIDGVFSYNAAEYLEKKGECSPTGYGLFKFEIGLDGQRTGLILSQEGQHMEREEIVESMKSYKKYIELQNESNPNISYKVLCGDISIEYDIDESIQTKLKAKAKAWSGGNFEYGEDGSMTGIIQTNSKEFSKRDMVGFLSALAMKGVDIQKVNLTLSDGQAVNAETYLMTLQKT